MPTPVPRRTLSWLLLAVLESGAACAPDTDLTQIPSHGGVAGPIGPGGAALVDPEAGTPEVPVNLAAVVVRFPAPISWGAAGLQLCDGAVASAPPEELTCEGGVCYRAPLIATLPAATSCRVTLTAGATDAAGAPVPSGLIGVFDTAAAPDERPPALGEVTVTVAGPCLAVGFATDEPTTGTVVLSVGDLAVTTAAGSGQTRFDLAVPLGALPPSTPATLTVRVTDRAGNVVESAPFAFDTPAPLPSLAITEVLSNPAGPEPAQEYVELSNLGDLSLSLAGLRLEDTKGGDDLPDVALAPGEMALIVASGYVEQQGQDPSPRFGTTVVRVDARLGSDGLANGGEIVRLKRGEDVVSSYGGWVSVSASSWAGRSVHRLIPSACDRAEAWNRTPLEPTPGWGTP
jgi:hypothetical protein